MFAQDWMRDGDFVPDLLTHDSLFTGWYTISCVVKRLTAILKTRAAF